ncbi:hypothetical protein FQA47_017912 [Oryzias melastigma]|uniref:exodeoxyribonuclease III n=1 Tax=Oryzias melastigma TaxID=30732 RepID=A0A834F1G0_ORYME|nr:hypothetical protein FQA47_017912 [Oryzias melastigma]
MQNLESDGGESAPRALVFFDLETTGLGPNCEIIQLAAVSGGHSLNLYVVPHARIERGAAKVTGFKVCRHRLFLRHQPCLHQHPQGDPGLLHRLLQMFKQPFLVCHNIRHFDCPLLVRALDRLELREQFGSSVSACVDTLPLAREVLSGRNLQSFSQEKLVRELLGVNYKAHDALEDVRALQMLYTVIQPTAEQVRRHTFTLDSVERKTAFSTKDASGKV